MTNAQTIAQKIQGFRPDDRQQQVRDQAGYRYQAWSFDVPPDGQLYFLNGANPTAFPVSMVTIQALPMPWGGVVGPVSLWLHQRAVPNVDPPVCVMVDNKPFQLFFGGQFVTPVLQNNGLTPVRVNITCTESI